MTDTALTELETLAPEDKEPGGEPARTQAQASGRVHDYEIATESGFDFLGDAYRQLYAASSASVFQHPLWLDRIYRTLVPAYGLTPLVLTVCRRDNGQLEAVLPLIRRRLAGLRLVEYADLCVSDYTAAVTRKGLWERLMADEGSRTAVLDAMRPFDLLRIKHLTDEGLAIKQLVPEAHSYAMPFSSHGVSIDCDYESWRRQAFSKRLRKKIAQGYRKLEKSGPVNLRHINDPEQIGYVHDVMRDLRKPRYAGRAGHDLMQVPLFQDFYRQIAIAGIDCGLAHTYVLSVGERIAAAVFGLAHGGRFHFLLLAADYQAFGAASPGYLIYDAVMRERVAAGDRMLDFTIGDEPFKVRFGTEPATVHALNYGDTLRGRLAERAANRFQQVRPWIKRFSDPC